ncbi:MAG TPA: nucleotide exchange factor GrpE [Firmicutes bacterium]|nr:nucleotide exchange factor GrpE [Bacillota bacterium]
MTEEEKIKLQEERPKEQETVPAGAAERTEAEPEAAEAPVPEAEDLAARLAAAEEKAADYLTQLTRLKADFVNYRRRVEREQTELTAYANARLLKELLAVLDNLERALAAGPDAPPEALRQGVEQVVRQFQAVLSKEGVEALDPGLGKPFNPEYQEALLREEGEPEVVVAELQRGYRYHDRVLRPTLVKVGPQPPQVESAAEEPCSAEEKAEATDTGNGEVD